MANCPVCGSVFVTFENPHRQLCPTPERHEASKRPMRDNGRRRGQQNRGKPNSGRRRS